MIQALKRLPGFIDLSDCLPLTHGGQEEPQRINDVALAMVEARRS
jgi:hypothetical protein